MAEGMSMAPDMGLNTANTSSESKEVSQEDMVRVSESMRKAAQMGGQIRDDQQKNSQLAKFLEFLFSAVRSDEVWEIVVGLCTKPDSTGKGTTLSLHEMIAFFVPFFPHEVAEYNIESFVIGLPHADNVQIDGYTSYVHSLRRVFPLIQSMDVETVAALVVAILQYFGYAQVEEDKKQETIDSIKGFLLL